MKKCASVIVAALAAGTVLLATGGGANAAVPTASKTYTSCAQMNQDKYPHGVGKKGAVDKTSGKKVTAFAVENAVYKRYSTSASKGSYYRDLDRDNDGIACERR